MKKLKNDKNSRPWCGPWAQNDPEYDDLCEFWELMAHIMGHPNEQFYVRIWRQTRRGNYLYLREGDAIGHDLDDIKHLYGGGTYKVKFLNGKKQFMRTLHVGIADCFRGIIPLPNI